MAVSEAPRFVQLKNGPALPVEPILLALELEERGFILQRMPDDVLSVQPHELLMADDCARIKRWKWHLLSIVDYEPEVIQ